MAKLIVEPDCELTADEIDREIHTADIVFGRKSGAVNQALQFRGVAIIIAEGKAPQPGRPAELTLFLDETLLTAEANSSVADNLRQELVIASVKPGQVLAKVTPAEPGIPGLSIHGKELPAPAEDKIHLRALKGATLSDDGLQVTAAVIGRPRLEKKKNIYSFQVIPCFVHRGDVTVQQGHISFQGDISIIGNVTEGTFVSALGNIEVFGNVIGAKVSAGQSVSVSGNVIQGTLEAGIYYLLVAEILLVLDELNTLFIELLNMLNQLSSSPHLAKLPFSHIVKQVITMRNLPWDETLKKLENAIEKIKPPALADEVKKARKLIENLTAIAWQDIGSLSSAVASVRELRRNLEEAGGTGGDIKVSYSLNSTLTAGRNILIRGQGCMHSHLNAGEEVRIDGRLRGGDVITSRLLYAREVGSEAGAATTLSVSAKGRIEVDKAFENTLFTVGSFTYKLSETTGRSRTAFNENGHLYLLHRH
jgi:hypothetical protein